MNGEIEIREKLQAEVAPIVARAAAVVIATAQDYQVAGEYCKEVAKAIREVGVRCDPLCEATDKAHKAAVAMRASFLDPLKAAKKLLSDKQLAWAQAEAAKAEAEQRRLQAIENERVRKEQEKIDAAARIQREKEAAALAAEEAAREAGDLKAAEAARKAAATAAAKAEAKEEAAQMVAPAALVTVASAAPVVKGQHITKTWKASIIEKRRAIEWALTQADWEGYVDLNEGAFNAFAKRTKGAVAVPGVQFREVSGLASSSR